MTLRESACHNDIPKHLSEEIHLRILKPPFPQRLSLQLKRWLFFLYIHAHSCHNTQSHNSISSVCLGTSAAVWNGQGTFSQRCDHCNRVSQLPPRRFTVIISSWRRPANSYQSVSGWQSSDGGKPLNKFRNKNSEALRFCFLCRCLFALQSKAVFAVFPITWAHVYHVFFIVLVRKVNSVNVIIQPLRCYESWPIFKAGWRSKLQLHFMFCFLFFASSPKCK